MSILMLEVFGVRVGCKAARVLTRAGRALGELGGGQDSEPAPFPFILASSFSRRPSGAPAPAARRSLTRPHRSFVR